MELTPDQQNALTGILEFVRCPVDWDNTEPTACASVLFSAAGCGKSYLTRIIAQKVKSTHRLVGVAPTHKARKVLDAFINGESLLKIKTMTIASLLSKLRHHSYIATKNYSGGSDTKIQNYDLFIIDEASMITDKDANTIMYYAHQYKRKVIFIGDNYQIPNPSQQYQLDKTTKIYYKKDCLVFNLPIQFELITNVRQGENPIIDIYTEYRNAIKEKREANIIRKKKIKNDKGVYFYTNSEKWQNVIFNDFKQIDIDIIDTIRIIAYTNNTVRNHNMAIRKLFNRGTLPEKGELLMGYNNLGWPVPIIENSQDYYVTKVVETQNWKVIAETGSGTYSNLVGSLITILATSQDSIANTVFMPDISASENQKMLLDLVKRAEKVNSICSSKEDFKTYCRLKNKLVFMENIYKYNGEIISESQFKTGHPLLFKSVKEVINDTNDGDGDRLVIDNKLCKELKGKYGEELLADRICDDKPLSESERLSDKYCVIEKDIDFGYCITAHKSQGSNYNTVYVDEADFDKMTDHWNHYLNGIVGGVKEKNQLKYVACTRPTDKAHIFYKNFIA